MPAPASQLQMENEHVEQWPQHRSRYCSQRIYITVNPAHDIEVADHSSLVIRNNQIDHQEADSLSVANPRTAPVLSDVCCNRIQLPHPAGQVIVRNLSESTWMPAG